MNMESQIQNINVDLIIPNRFQPRLTFDENALNELAKSIKEHGIIQPLVLRRVNDKYEIIAGERRYKAAVLAGLSEVPAIITTIDDNKSAEVALVENVQRKNLNSMEEAKSYKKILDKGYLTQEALAQKMGISQSNLANKLRLLNLAPEVQEALVNGKISERHARSLLLVEDKLRQVSLLNRVIAERLTVRQLDAIIKSDNNVSKQDESSSTILEEKPTIEQNDVEQPFVVDNPAIEPDAQPDNIFDSSEKEEETIDNSQESTEDSKVREEYPSAVSLIESLDDEEPTINEEAEEKVPNPLDGILNKLNVPIYSSLEDEVTNMDLDTEEYFNPFNNLNEAESLPVKEEPKEINEQENSEVKEEPSSKSIVKEGNLESVKEAYENLKKEIEDAGFKITSEDFDFEDIYQLIIKIDKQV